MTDNRTTELREKLTERAIEYTTNDHLGAYETSWDGFTAMQLTPGAKLMMVFTPEQAIAATLGSDDKSRWHELFGTPERAASTLKNGTPLCGWCDKQTCEENGGECSLFYYDVLLEWLKGAM